jgi:hypothetical protein
MNIYVGNISRNATEADLKEAFEAHGAVASVVLIKDKLTGDSRGFGYAGKPVLRGYRRRGPAGFIGYSLGGSAPRR